MAEYRLKRGKPTYAKVSVSVKVKVKGKKPLTYRQDAMVKTSEREMKELVRQLSQAKKGFPEETVVLE